MRDFIVGSILIISLTAALYFVCISDNKAKKRAIKKITGIELTQKEAGCITITITK